MVSKNIFVNSPLEDSCHVGSLLWNKVNDLNFAIFYWNYFLKDEKRPHNKNLTTVRVVHRETRVSFLDVRFGKSYLSQLLRVLVEFFQDGQSLLLGTVLQDTLDHPTAIWMSGQNKHLHTKKGHKTLTHPGACVGQ